MRVTGKFSFDQSHRFLHRMEILRGWLGVVYCVGEFFGGILRGEFCRRVVKSVYRYHCSRWKACSKVFQLENCAQCLTKNPKKSFETFLQIRSCVMVLCVCLKKKSFEMSDRLTKMAKNVNCWVEHAKIQIWNFLSGRKKNGQRHRASIQLKRVKLNISSNVSKYRDLTSFA